MPELFLCVRILRIEMINVGHKHANGVEAQKKENGLPLSEVVVLNDLMIILIFDMKVF